MIQNPRIPRAPDKYCPLRGWLRNSSDAPPPIHTLHPVTDKNILDLVFRLRPDMYLRIFLLSFITSLKLYILFNLEHLSQYRSFQNHSHV